MKRFMHRSLEALVSVMLVGFLTNVAAARCIKIANSSECTDVVRIDEIFADKRRFDKQKLAIEGIAATVKETLSCAKNAYTTIVVRDQQTGGKITVFSFGHLGIKNNAPIQCSGSFQMEKIVHSRCDGQYRQFRFYDQIDGICESK